MSNLPAPVPVDIVEAVDRFVDDEHRDARKYTNREVLDESGIYTLHTTAASIYARGYDDGRRAERARANAERTREREKRQDD